jgi:hypothetical protein
MMLAAVPLTILANAIIGHDQPAWKYMFNFAVSVWLVWLFWRDDDDNYWRRKRKKLGAWLRSNLRRPVVAPAVPLTNT